MHRRIEIAVKNKIATQTNDVVYICGNSDFVIDFDFDSEWNDSPVKTARFITEDMTVYDQVFEGNECHVPVISDTYKIRVGVYAGNLRTTTPAYIPAKKSILCGSGTPEAPPKSVYDQIMGKVNEAVKASDGKIDKAQGTEHAGKLMFVDGDGMVTVLSLGDGLEIIDGVLKITSAKVAAAICGQFLCGDVYCGEE